MRNVAEYLEAQASTLLKKEESSGVWTPEKVHECRVGTRRARMSLWWLEQASKQTKKLRKARKLLGDFGRVLGERRQWDVLLKDAQKYGLDPQPLEAARIKAREALQAFQDSDKTKKIEKKVLKAVEKAKELSELDVSRPIKKLKKRLQHWKDLPPMTETQFHECRIDLKKTRYVLEALGLDVTELKRIQDWLGQAHDLEILQQTLGKNDKVSKDEAMARNAAQDALPSTLTATIERLESLENSKADKN